MAHWSDTKFKEVKFEVLERVYKRARTLANEQGTSIEAKCADLVRKMSSDSNKKVRAIRLKRARQRRTGAKSRYDLSEYGKRCMKCGSTEKICKDHIIPISKGGTDDEDNKQLLCVKCNSEKGTNDFDYRVSALKRMAEEKKSS